MSLIGLGLGLAAQGWLALMCLSQLDNLFTLPSSIRLRDFLI